MLGIAVSGLAGAERAEAGVGFFVDASTLEFSYVKGAGGQGSIGRITISDILSSNLTLQQLDLGADGEIGGNDDTLIDLAEIGDPSQFSVSFVGDVFKNGANDYTIIGTLGIGDINSPPEVILGDFTSASLQVGGGFFAFDGSLSNPNGLLQPDQSDSWLFTGLAGDTADIINGVFGGADNVDGTVTLANGRGSYRRGSLVDFQFVGKFADLDAFFDAARQGSTGADMKITVVPVPAAWLLASLGIAGAYAIRRRMA